MSNDDLAVEVTITPRDARRQAAVIIPVSVVLIVVALVLPDSRIPVLGVIGLVLGIARAVQAKQRVTRVLVRIDREGITTDDGLHDVRWNGAALIWVGPTTFLGMGQPQLLIFTRAGVDFARRSKTRLHPVSSFALPSHLTGADFCARLARLTDARVVDGNQTSLREAKRILTG